MSEKVDVLAALQEDKYCIGNLQALRYSPNVLPFYDGWIGKLYELCQQSKIVERIFGGNPPSTFDGVVSYLSNKPLIVMGQWEPEELPPDVDDPCEVRMVFKEAGFAFPIITCGFQKPEISAFCGFGFFKWAWGTPELPVLGMMGLAYMFQEWGFKAIHGTRYVDNPLAARFMRQFGMKDIGTIPNYQLRDGVLSPAVISSLDRADFEKYVEEFLVAQYRLSLQQQPVAEPVAEPEKPAAPVQGSLAWM